MKKSMTTGSRKGGDLISRRVSGLSHNIGNRSVCSPAAGMSWDDLIKATQDPNLLPKHKQKAYNELQRRTLGR